jgi:hypothetical protein
MNQSWDNDIQTCNQVLSEIEKFEIFMKLKYPDWSVPDLLNVKRQIQSEITNCKLNNKLEDQE